MTEGAFVDCPHCGEPIELTVDTSVGAQSYYEDCPVCCSPMEGYVVCRPGAVVSLSATRD